MTEKRKESKEVVERKSEEEGFVIATDQGPDLQIT